MKGVVVVGAGIAGLACARVVADGGIPVRVLDRGRRPGGRLATRMLRDGGPPHPADTGAPYFTVSDDDFRAVVEGWRAKGLAREWTDTFATAGPFGIRDRRTGPMRWASVRGARALMTDLADGLDVQQETDLDAVGVHGMVRKDHPRIVVLAMPGPQAERLLRQHHADLAAVADQPYDPTLALAVRFEQRSWPDFDGAFVSDVPEIRWIADDGAARGDGAAVLVAHSTPEFARKHLDRPHEAEHGLLRAVRAVLGVRGDPVEAHVQRWTFAQPTSSRGTTFHLGDDGLALCGDGWSGRSRVEAAWRSGTDLGRAIAARLG